jgi:predicted DsbA family dithiol-disulfide isomerase
MLVEIWSDVVCPWCYIGKRRFETARSRVAEALPDVDIDAAIQVRYRAFQLDPSAPTDRFEPVREVYERKFGGPEAAQAIIDRVTVEAAGEGLDFRLHEAKRANTLGAHRLLVLAEREGIQAQVKERLLAAYFTEGKAIGDPEVLVGEAEAAGLDAEVARAWLADDGGRAEVVDHLAYAADNGLTGVPSFVFDREVAISGAQDPELFVRILTKRLTS